MFEWHINIPEDKYITIGGLCCHFVWSASIGPFSWSVVLELISRVWINSFCAPKLHQWISLENFIGPYLCNWIGFTKLIRILSAKEWRIWVLGEHCHQQFGRQVTRIGGTFNSIWIHWMYFQLSFAMAAFTYMYYTLQASMILTITLLDLWLTTIENYHHWNLTTKC